MVVFLLRPRQREFPAETFNDVSRGLLKSPTRGHNEDIHMMVIGKGFHRH